MAPEGAERAPVKLLHALLLHGATDRVRTLEDFWPVVTSKSGKPISRNTGSSAVRELEKAHLVVRRPLRFGPGLGLVVGVSVGTESLRAGLFDANGRLLEAESDPGVGGHPNHHAVEEIHDPRQLEHPRDVLLDRIQGAVHGVVARALRDRSLLVEEGLPLLGVAVAWPSPLNRWTKVPTGRALHDHAWRTLDASGNQAIGVNSLVGQRLGLEVGRSNALNDANAVALGAAFDRSRALNEDGTHPGGVVLALRVGGGIGAGTVVLGSSMERLTRSQFPTARLLEGAGGYAGELGHFQVPAPDLLEVLGDAAAAEAMANAGHCVCGRSRCLQLFAGGTAVERILSAGGLPISDLKKERRRHPLVSLGTDYPMVGDERVRATLLAAGRLIGRALEGPVLMLNPESITVAGALALKPLLEGIDRERDRWEHVHQGGLELLTLDPLVNRFAAARGAALAVFRARVFRHLDRGLNLADGPMRLDRAVVDMWRLQGGGDTGAV